MLSYKYNLKDKLQIIDFEDINDIPENIEYLHIDEISIRKKYNYELLDLSRFKNLIKLKINDTMEEDIMLFFSRIHEDIEFTNLDNIIIYNGPQGGIKKLILEKCIVNNTFLKQFKHLQELELTNVKIDFNDIPNLEILYINSIDNIKEINLNKLINLRKLYIFDLDNLEILHINKLSNLKEIELHNLEKLTNLNFERSRLDNLILDKLHNFKYIDGYIKKGITGKHIYRINNMLPVKVTSRRRIYLLCESKVGTRNGLAETPPKGPVEDVCESKVGTQNGLSEQNSKCICGNCGRFVNSYNKLNIRNNKHLNYNFRFEDENFLDYYKMLSCC